MPENLRRVVYKQQPVLVRHLDNGFIFGIELPDSAEVIYVGLQGDGDMRMLTFWYTANTGCIESSTQRKYTVVGTGMDSEHIDPQRHVVTIFEERHGPGIYDTEDHVWHIFEVSR